MTVLIATLKTMVQVILNSKLLTILYLKTHQVQMLLYLMSMLVKNYIGEVEVVLVRSLKPLKLVLL